ncbi:MAG: hypothetical protein RSC44_04495, partial [Clostridia bacterium]
MLINQIAVFIENSQGRLHDVVKVISTGGVNIQSLNIADTDEFGIARMVTSDNKTALKLLADAGFTANDTDLIGVEVSDTPGTLCNVLGVLDENDISIEYIYSFTCSEGKTLILLKTDQMEKAQKALFKRIKDEAK